jgi:hypothetical protein
MDMVDLLFRPSGWAQPYGNQPVFKGYATMKNLSSFIRTLIRLNSSTALRWFRQPELICA